VNARRNASVVTSVHFLPRISDRGARKTGPIPMPSVYSVKLRVAMVSETWKWSMRAGMTGSTTAEAKALGLLVTVVFLKTCEIL
jgi:hypothetical protein